MKTNSIRNMHLYRGPLHYRVITVAPKIFERKNGWFEWNKLLSRIYIGNDWKIDAFDNCQSKPSKTTVCLRQTWPACMSKHDRHVVQQDSIIPCRTVSGVHHFLSSNHWSFHVSWTCVITWGITNASNIDLFLDSETIFRWDNIVLTYSCEIPGSITWREKRMTGVINLRMEENKTTAFSRADNYS